MKSILSFVFLFTILGIKAQNNLVVFSENGEKFFLFVNGVKQNIEAETNVKVVDLIQPNYKTKIVFEDKAKGVVDQNVYFMQGGEPVTKYEFVFSVSVSKKGGYKARPVSAVSIAEVKKDPAQTVVHYSTTEPTENSNNVISDGTDNTNVNVSTDANGNSSNTQVNQTVTKTQTTNGNTNNTTNVGINMNGLGVNINVNDGMGGGMNNNTTTTTSQTVTTTTASSGTVKNTNSQSQLSNTNSGNNPPRGGSPKGQAAANPLPGYTGAVGCPMPMSSTEFGSVKTSISSKSFDDTKEKMAKQVIDNNCLLSSQVKEIMELFSFEATRLSLANTSLGLTFPLKMMPRCGRPSPIIFWRFLTVL